MDQELFDWLLLLGRWLHITTAITWIGTSIFFMWLDRTFEPNPESKRPGHVGDLWMVHGGGFYHVEKLQMGPTKVPEHLHWFKWESYWTWMSGMLLMTLVFYVGQGTFLLDPSVSRLSFAPGALLGLFSIFGSWIFYDFLWEHSLTKKDPVTGHVLTVLWLAGMSFGLCHALSGRAAYMHIGAMLGTWMTANVFLRIIPRQVKMVAAAKAGLSVDPEWAKNAKNRSTHNTYFTLPVIFIMLSNHFPATYGHEANWFILLVMCAAGAAIRQYFVVRLKQPNSARGFAALGIALLLFVMGYSRFSTSPGSTIGNSNSEESYTRDTAPGKTSLSPSKSSDSSAVPDELSGGISLMGHVEVEGTPRANRPLTLPKDCAKAPGSSGFSDEVIVHEGRLQNVLVRVLRGHESLPVGSVPTTSVELDQSGCLYRPRVVVARVGQEVNFLNSDPLLHNVRSIAAQNPNFNFSMPQPNQRLSRRFEKPEIFVQTRCSVHPWMSAFIAVVEHPYFSLSDANGEFEIKHLMPGKYTLEFWHEVYGVQTRDIDVTASGVAPLTVKFR